MSNVLFDIFVQISTLDSEANPHLIDFMVFLPTDERRRDDALRRKKRPRLSGCALIQRLPLTERGGGGLRYKREEGNKLNNIKKKRFIKVVPDSKKKEQVSPLCRGRSAER